MMNVLREIEVTYRNPMKISESTRIVQSKDIETLLRKIWSDNIEFCESFYLICLNRSNRVLGWVKTSQGGLSGTVVDIRHIFSIALKANSASIVVAHNHPSANTKPSEQDIQITKKIKDAGRLLDIPLLDHVILTNEGYLSFADEGIL
jgi:DNA repair protein RadC